MEILWKYDLPTDESSEDYHYEGPLLVQGDNLYFICDDFTNHQHKTVLYTVDKTSGETRKTFCLPKKTTIPSKCFFEMCGDKIIIYTGTLWLLDGEHLSELLDQAIDDKINSHFIYENYFARVVK